MCLDDPPSTEEVSVDVSKMDSMGRKEYLPT